MTGAATIGTLTVSRAVGYVGGPTLDLVIQNGQVIDPESHLNEVCNVGVQDGHIAAVTRTPLSGRRTVDAKGLVVAPGFIDWHAHGQNALADRVQVFDGVTTTQTSCPMATV